MHGSTPKNRKFQQCSQNLQNSNLARSTLNSRNDVYHVCLRFVCLHYRAAKSVYFTNCGVTLDEMIVV